MDLVNKLWGFCNKLRHDGVDSSDYIEQLTYLLFLKMAKEKQIDVPKGCDWSSLVNQNKANLISHLEVILQTLKSREGLLGDIFSEPVSRVRNVNTLSALVKEIDEINWSGFEEDVVGLAFEELIGRVAKEGKKGAGQYFTPRPLIQIIVNVMKPDPTRDKNYRIGDVAVGTAGFLIVASEWIKDFNQGKKTGSHILKRIKNNTFFGQELVQRPRRLALMNMFLHGINAQIRLTDTIYGDQDDILYDCILTNPPFGNKGVSQIPDRKFPIKTSDKQLNFIQHVMEKLKHKGRAAIVLPDSCLSSEVSKKIWSFYLENPNEKEACNLHTILKLPEGVFAAYANGIKACVLFFQKGLRTKDIWTYDARKDVERINTTKNVLSEKHFNDFEICYGSDPNGNSVRVENERFKRHSINDVKANNFSLSFVEIYQSENVVTPISLLTKMITDYELKIKTLKKLKKTLEATSLK